MLNFIECKDKIDKERYGNQPYEVAELICLNCRQRWIGVYPVSSLLKDAECECGAKGLIIKTGQIIGGES